MVQNSDVVAVSVFPYVLVGFATKVPKHSHVNEPQSVYRMLTGDIFSEMMFFILKGLAISRWVCHQVR